MSSRVLKLTTDANGGLVTSYYWSLKQLFAPNNAQSLTELAVSCVIAFMPGGPRIPLQKLKVTTRQKNKFRHTISRKRIKHICFSYKSVE